LPDNEVELTRTAPLAHAIHSSARRRELQSSRRLCIV